MKKFFYLVLMLVAFATLFSCTKDDDLKPEDENSISIKKEEYVPPVGG